MDIWELLGIAPTRKRRDIKRAYAQQIARYHPEDHPDEFQLVQMAYERALLYADGKTGHVPTSVQRPASAGERTKKPKSVQKREERAGEEPAVPPEAVEISVVEVDQKRAEKGLFGDEEPPDPSDILAVRARGVDGFIKEALLEDAQEVQEARCWLEDLDRLLDRGESAADYLESKRGQSNVLRSDYFESRLAEELRPHVDAFDKREIARLLQLFPKEGSDGDGHYQLLGVLNVRRAVLYARRDFTLVMLMLIIIFLIGSFIVAIALDALGFETKRIGFRSFGIQQKGTAESERRKLEEEKEELAEQKKLTDDLKWRQEEIARKQPLVDAHFEENKQTIVSYLQEHYGGTWTLAEPAISLQPFQSTSAYVDVVHNESGQEFWAMVTLNSEGTVSAVTAIIDPALLEEAAETN